MWQGIERSLWLSRAALGTTYVLWSARSTAPGAGPAVAGILGARHLAQALLTADQPTSAVLLLGAEADAAHAASMALLAAVSGRWRRYALGDALIAASLAAIGLTCAANAPAGDPGAGRLLAGRDRWADWLARRLRGLPAEKKCLRQSGRGPGSDARPPRKGLATSTAVSAATSPAFVQGNAFATGGRVASVTSPLTSPVGAGDLLVGWFAQYNTSGQVQVSENVNGAWTRAPASTAFQNDTGDIALYYLSDSKAAPNGLTVTVSDGATAYLQGSLADYSGVAVAGPLDQIVSSRGVGTAVDTGPTAPVPAGELIFSALVTGGSPASVTPGTSDGVTYSARAQTSSGSAYGEDILSSAAGAQDGRATLAASTDWYAVAATFRPVSTGDTQPPSVPASLHATSVASTSVSLAWSPSTDNVGVTGYTVYRNGVSLGTVSTTSFTDNTVSPGTAMCKARLTRPALVRRRPPSR